MSTATAVAGYGLPSSTNSASSAWLELRSHGMLELCRVIRRHADSPESAVLAARWAGVRRVTIETRHVSENLGNPPVVAAASMRRR
jgi:hypothetical protein